MKHIIYISLLMVVGCSVAFGQDEGGEIENVEIEIVKDKQITLPKASRNFEKVPPRPADAATAPMTYDFKTMRFESPDYNPNVKPLKLKDEPLSKIYGNYVSAGYGNYNSPFLRGSISSKRNAEKFYGVDFLHHSFGKGPVDGKNSGGGYSKVNGYVSGMGPKVTADLGLTYENLFNHFYGYRPTNVEVLQENIRQTYNIIGLNGGLTNTKPSDFNFKLTGDFSYLYDRFEASESDAGVHFNSRYDFNGRKSVPSAGNHAKKELVFKGDYFIVARKDSKVEAKPRHLLKINPSYIFTIAEKLEISAGVNAVVQNDTIGKSKAFHLYPDAWIHYPAAKTVDAYAGITGDYEKVSLHTLARENQWINSNINIFHTNKSFEFRAGVQGKVARKFSFHLGTSVINFKNLYFYENVVTDRSKFNVVYDDAVRMNFFGEIGVVGSDKVSINVRGDYYSYSMNKLDYPWQRPQYKAGFYSSYKLIDKILLTVNLVSQGGAKAYDNETNRVVTLKPAMNLDAKIRYFITKPLSAYVEGNNLLNTKYFIYQYYQARGVQVSAGLSWSF
ncbi:MAG TPA: hypothetical protein VFE50_10685 [Cyclobacteriaceae bacterium]|nr:hypothetical protein [Cyclobacteriaceae bacterium]